MNKSQYAAWEMLESIVLTVADGMTKPGPTALSSAQEGGSLTTASVFDMLAEWAGWLRKAVSMSEASRAEHRTEDEAQATTCPNCGCLISPSGGIYQDVRTEKP